LTRLAVAPAVANALAAGRPVVALETTLVTHGLPHPEGIETAEAMETAVRTAGAVAATIGILDGAVRVGLSGPELERLAGDPSTAKVNLANLASVLASGGAGSTTVAATMFAARHTGIRVFATGGIGGVHRGTAGDVSADLVALARFEVAVVCAGAKAVLDLPRTREALETLGVPVYGWRTERFPAFDRRDSGLPVDRRFDEAVELAAAVAAHLDLEIGGLVIGNPIAVEHELNPALHERALAAALAHADRAGVRGRDVTPFLLERMRDLTGGATLAANRALLLSNAKLAAELAGVLAQSTLKRRSPAGFR
jgi:pseudouridine-5'-phosphate glycosidase